MSAAIHARRIDCSPLQWPSRISDAPASNGDGEALTIANDTTWAIAALSIFGVIARPWKLPEATWSVSGAVMLIVFGLLPWSDALKAVAKGTDVYLFLSGMMLLAARKEGLFDFLAGPIPLPKCQMSGMLTRAYSPNSIR